MKNSVGIHDFGTDTKEIEWDGHFLTCAAGYILLFLLMAKLAAC